MKSRFYILLLILLLSLYTEAQSYKLTSESKRAKKFYTEAESLYILQEYNKAEEALFKSLKSDEDFMEAKLLLGDVFRDQNKTQMAISVYIRIIESNPDFFPAVYLFLADLLMEEGEYDRAIEYYRDFLLKDGIKPERALLAQFGHENAVFRKQATEKPVIDKIVQLDSNINTTNDEYINFVNEDLNTLILTKRDFGPLGLASSSFTEYFMESSKVNSKWSPAKKLLVTDTEGLNMGGMSLSFDGKQMYLTACYWPENIGSCDIYTTRLYGNKWPKPRPMPAVLNSPSWDSQASISPDGMKLYFSSKRKGGKGGSDIWMSIKLNNGKWSPAINMGDSINTSGDEMSPFIHADGISLYYSSNGTVGMGDFDILLSKKSSTGQWTKGKNLGYPVNGAGSDINIFVSIDGNRAWKSSKCEGSIGGFDIYAFEMPESSKPKQVITLKGKIADSITKKYLDASIEITDLINGELISRSFSNSFDGEFLSVLHPNRKYLINISSSDYLFYSASLTLSDKTIIEKTFNLVKIETGASIDLYNIYFNIDESSIQSESLPELNRLVELMTINPELKILIEGHTDSSGDNTHNLKLSENRAQSVMNYLTSKGIDGNRLSFKGFGSSIPIADNKTEEGRALNRRTRISVL